MYICFFISVPIDFQNLAISDQLDIYSIWVIGPTTDYTALSHQSF